MTAPANTRIAYLLSRYPAISHTFFLHEVLGLREKGLHIETASINEPDRGRDELPEMEAAEAAKTFYVKAGSKGKAAIRVLSIAAKHPAVFLRGVRAVLNLPSLTVRKRALWMAYLAEALLTGDWMRRRNLPHLHVHFGGPVASVGMLVARAWQVPFSLTIHGPEELQDYSSHHLAEKVAAANFVLCISDFAKSQLMQRMVPADWHKLHVVRLGVSGDLLASPERDARDRSAPVHVVCVGRLVPEKGQRLLLEAIAHIRNRGVDVRATLVGDGRERTALQARAEELGITPHVHFAGSRSHAETVAIVRTADIFALPSFAEGIPVALMEAMALEVPCVSTSVAGIPELIRNGQDGLLTAPANVDELTLALHSLAVDRDLRCRLGTSARARVMDAYNLPKNHAALATLFEEQVAGTRA